MIRKVENGKSITDVKGGQFISFISDICYESNKKGVGVGHGSLKYNESYSSDQISIYIGSSYWGKDSIFKFNADKSVLNIALENGDIYIYKRTPAPPNAETCSLIKRSNSTTQDYTRNDMIPFNSNIPDNINDYSGNNILNTDNNKSDRKQKQLVREECNYCKGKRTIPIDNGVSFGLDEQKYCSDCGKYVSLRHRHEVCPSCKGKGYTEYYK